MPADFEGRILSAWPLHERQRLFAWREEFEERGAFVVDEVRVVDGQRQTFARTFRHPARELEERTFAARIFVEPCAAEVVAANTDE